MSRRRQVSSEESEGSESDTNMGPQYDEPESELDDDEVGDEQMMGVEAMDLVRYILMAEYNRVPIRRQKACQAVFGDEYKSHPKFKTTLSYAQRVLMRDFNMELVPLPETIVPVALQGEQNSKKRKPTSTQEEGDGEKIPDLKGDAFVLRSTLSSSIRDILPDSRSSFEQVYNGVVTVILTLLVVSNGYLSRTKMLDYVDEQLLMGALSIGQLDTILTRMTRQGYIDVVRNKEGEPGAEPRIYYVLGRRAQIEGTHSLFHEVTKAIMGDLSEDLGKAISDKCQSSNILTTT